MFRGKKVILRRMSSQHTRPAQQKDQQPNSSVSDSMRFAFLIENIASQKDRDAFAELFAHFAPRVKGYLMRLGASNGQAEEVTQDAMLSVWRKAHLFDRKKASASTWIFTIARNRRIDVLRQQKYPELDANDPSLVPDSPAQPDDAVIAERRGEMVRAALGKLPEEQRELVRLAFYNGWSHGQLAAETNLPLGTVKSRLRLAFGRLRQELGDDI